MSPVARGFRRPPARIVALVIVASSTGSVSFAAERVDANLSALAAQAEAELAEGDVAAAIESFERATRMAHEPSAELGLVRAYVQSGQYRRALAYCAHVAGEHTDVPGAAVLYAELLRAGGQDAVARTVLAEASARSPFDALVRAAVQTFDASSPRSDDALLRPPHRIAPLDQSLAGRSPVPQEARIAASGVLLADGRRALVPTAATIHDGRRVEKIWVRDAFGRAREAAFDDDSVPTAAPGGVTVVRLRGQLSTTRARSVQSELPFAGSPAFVLEYAEGRPALPAWPRLRIGFLGATSGTTGARSLGIDIGEQRQGGPVLDSNGRVTGIVLRDDAQFATMLPVSQWPGAASADRDGTQPRPETPPSASPRAVLPVDELYERALHLVLQVIVVP